MAEVLCENQGLQTQGCCSLSTEHLICLLFLARWSIAETPCNVTRDVLFFNPPPRAPLAPHPSPQSSWPSHCAPTQRVAPPHFLFSSVKSSGFLFMA